jgi:predicted RNase H-like HicB family nuclease
MEQIIKIHIKKLPEGVFLATSKEVPGLVAQGRTATETLEIAHDIVKKLLEARDQRHSKIKISGIKDSFDYPMIVSA